MNLPAGQQPSFSQRALGMAGLFMPYFTVWLGLYVLKNAWAAILGYHLGILLLVTLAGAWPSLEKFRPGAPLWKIILFSLTGGLAGLAVYVLWPVIHVSPGLPKSLLEWGLGPGSWPLFIIYSALVNPWLEEIYWRNWLGSTQAHPVYTDAVFGGFHLIILAPFFPPFWLAVVFIILTASGWMWRQVVRTGNSLLASTLFHMVADVSILLVIWSTVGSWYET